jgi:hypothetical protein
MPSMSDAAGATIVLELIRAAPVPTGRLRSPHVAPESFEGWLQLLGALERVLQTLADTATDDGDEAGPPSAR